ncbi:unnamed protein product [Prunus armeniaca]
MIETIYSRTDVISLYGLPSILQKFDYRGNDDTRDGLPSVMEFPSTSRVRSTKGECKGEDLGTDVLTAEGSPMLKLAKYERSK